MIDYTWLKLFRVELFDLLTVEQDYENRICHEVNLVDLFITAVIAVKLDLLRFIVNVTKLNNLIPSDCHQRQGPCSLIRRESVAPVNRGYRLLLANCRPVYSLDRSRWELLHFNDCY